MTVKRPGLAALPERIAIVLKGRALVEDAFDLNLIGRTGPDRPVRTYMAALCGDVENAIGRPRRLKRPATLQA